MSLVKASSKNGVRRVVFVKMSLRGIRLFRRKDRYWETPLFVAGGLRCVLISSALAKFTLYFVRLAIDQ